MTKPVVIIIGANKGGVGKTLVSRAVLDFLQSNGIDYRPFDTETPQGDLKRFYPRAEVVDLTDSDGQVKVFDSLGDAVTVIDIRAGLLTETLQTLSDIGFINPEKYTLIVLHVLENSEVSIAEVKSLTDHVAGVRYVAVANSKNGAKFDFILPPGAIEIPMLDAKACRAVDAASATFSGYVKSGASAVLGGKVNHWLGLVFAQLASLRLP
jgi:hypothetical protein